MVLREGEALGVMDTQERRSRHMHTSVPVCVCVWLLNSQCSLVVEYDLLGHLGVKGQVSTDTAQNQVLDILPVGHLCKMSPYTHTRYIRRGRES